MNDKTYLFTEQQLRIFLEDTLIGANQHIFLKSHGLVREFLKELDMDDLYEQVMANW